jgi:hypothetical protein
VKINPLFLGLAAGVLFFLTRRTDAGESVGHGETAGGKPPKKGRTWDLANWSTTSTGAVIPPPAHALKNFGVDKAWKMTPDQEVSGSIARYAEILAGANNDPAGVFLWHISPVAYSYAKKQMKKGIPTRQAIRQGAASRGKKWEGVLQGYLKKWAKLYPAALEPVVAEQLYSGAFPSDFG